MFDLLEALWQGFQMIGAAITGLIKALLSLFGIPVADWMIQVATILILLVTVLKYAKHIPKLILIVLLLVLASIFVNAVLNW